MAVALQPDIWVEVDWEPYPASTTTTYRWAPRPFADAGAWKEARVASIGPIQRSLSDDDGHYEVARTTIVLDDHDGLIRGLLGTQSTSILTGRIATVKLLSESGRRAGTTPRMLFRGAISDVQLRKGRQIDLTITDLVGSSFSNFDLEKTIGVPIGSEHTNLPDESEGLIYPIIYGEHSDRGAEDANGDSAEKGLLPVIDTGDYHPFGEDIPTTYVSPPRNLVATKIGSGSGSRTYYYAVTGKTSFGETTISNVASVSGCPDRLDNNTYVELTWDQPATGASYVIAYPVYGRSTNPPSKRLDTMNNGGTFVNPEQIYRDGKQGSDADFDHEKSPGPPKSNTAVLEGENMAWGRLVVALGSVNVSRVLASDLADGTEPKRIAIDIDGPDVVTSNSGAWPHSDPFIEVGGIRQTVIYMRGPRLHAHRDGTVTVAVNACGYEDVGDGSGTMISQAFYQWQHLVNEHILKDEGVGYRTGTWGPLETYANGDAQIWTSKVEAAQDLSVERIGGLGYLGAIAIHEPTTVRELMRRFCLTFDAFLGVNHFGQVFPCLIDERANPATGRLYRDRIDLIELDGQRFDHDAVESEITYDYDWDADAQAFRVTDQRVADSDAAAALKGARFGDTQELYFTRDSATARDSRLRRLFRHKKAPRYIAVTTNLLGLEEELADPMRLTHYDGLGTDGDVNLPGFIRSHRVDRYAVTLEMLDLRRMGTLLVAGAGIDADGSAATGIPVSLSAPNATLVTATTVVSTGTNGIAFTVAFAETIQPGGVLAGAQQLTMLAPTAMAVGGAATIVADPTTLAFSASPLEEDVYYPTSATGLNYITYPAGPATAGFTVTADGSNHTKGAYTEVVASAPFTANAIIVAIQTTSANAGRLFLLDIATGGSGSETVVVPNLLCEGTTAATSAYGLGWIQIPLAIASGARVSVRCQCSTGGTTLGQVSIVLMAAGSQAGIASFVNYGADTSDSGGLQLDPGGTANTKAGSWTEITASTSGVIQSLSLLAAYGHTTVSTCSWAIDLAIGGAGSEVVLIPDLRVTSATNIGTDPTLQPRAQQFVTYIAAGTRIAARASCSINTATARLLDIALLAGTAP